MQRKLVYIFLFLGALLFPLSSSAQQKPVKFKNFREVKNDLKNKKNSDVENLIKKYTPADSIEKHYVSGMLNQYLSEQSNVNMYWGTKVDTAQVFKTVFTMFDEYTAAYPYIQKNETYARPVTLAFKSHQNNLRIGGNYFLSHGDYNQSYKFYNLFLKLYDQKLVSAPDSLMGPLFGNAVISANLSNKKDDVVRLAELAHQDNFVTEDIDFQLCDALQQMNRTEDWVKAVKRAIECHPDQFAFYGRLIDYYLKENHASDAMVLADDLIEQDSTNYLNCFVKGYVCQHTQDIGSALVWLHKSYEKKPDYIPALASLGYCKVKEAENVENSITHFPFTAQEKEQIKSIYKQAETYLEKCRELAPKEKEIWITPLWKAYYKLNEGDKLEQLEKIM